jgi:hypothetical protein
MKYKKLKKDFDELKDLQFLAEKSYQLLEKQILSYRQKHSNSGIIITILALFIPLFLNGLENSYTIIKILSVIPIVILICAFVQLIKVLKSTPLDQGFNVNEFDRLVNMDFEEILLYEIGANKSSFNDNQILYVKSSINYNSAVKLTLISIVLSTLLLLTNEFFKPNPIPTDVNLINKINMNNESKTNNTNSNNESNDENKTIKQRVVPIVPPKERTNLNEHLRPLTLKNDTDIKK